jgi:hypothetical protein
MRASAVAALAAATLVGAQQSGCGHDSGRGVTFDLTPLSSQTGYELIDWTNKTDTSHAHWAYKFSVCQNMQGGIGLPPSCSITYGVDGSIATSAWVLPHLRSTPPALGLVERVL